MRISTSTLMGHLDMALSNFVKGYRNAAFIADYLFPRLEVTRQADRYFIFGKEALQGTEQTLRASGTPAQQTKMSLSTAAYYCPSHALESVISDEERMAYTVGDLNMDAADLNQQKIMRDREFRAMVKATTPGNYPSGNTLALSGTAQWDVYASSDPATEIEEAKAAIRLAGAVQPNLLVLSDDVATSLRNHPKLVERFKYVVVAGGLNDQQLATALNVAQVIVGSAVTNDADTGLNGFIWKNVAILMYVTPTVGAAGVLGAEGTVGPKTISFGKSFTWTGAPETVGGYGVVIARHPQASAKSDVVSVDWYSTEEITGSDVGYLWTNVLAANN